MGAHLQYAMVSNGQVLALVGPGASIDWLCLPRFDSPSLFAALLDAKRGGRFALVPRASDASCSQRYHPNTNIVESTFTDNTGGWSVTDFCPVGDPAPSEIVRIVRPLEGTPELCFSFDPRPDYGGIPVSPTWDEGILRIHGDMQLAVTHSSEVILSGEPFALKAPLVITLSSGAARTSVVFEKAEAALEEAQAADRAFVARLTGTLSEPVRRSALALRGLTYGRTGAIIAAATTSIPEAFNEERNWDYRYTWIRDGCLAAESLLRLGESSTAERFLNFLSTCVDPFAPQPLYRVEGETELLERELDHFCGFGDTGPVRVGNAAAEQVQNDVFGQPVWLAERLHHHTGWSPDDALWIWLRKLVSQAAERWRAVDAGIWEFRDRPGHYLFSQLWCWKALSCGATLAGALGETAERDRWSLVAQEVREQILKSAQRVGFFAQAREGEETDASSLCVGLLGLIDPDDPLYHATIKRCEAELRTGDFMRRYAIRDDFGTMKNTFSLCTLWWIEALAVSGRREEARDRMERLLARGNQFGLFSEDIAPETGELMGNFPQAFTHLGIINASLALR